MEGRRSGTPGGDRAARHLAAALASYGLRPGGDAGTYLQSFVVATGTRLAQPTAIALSAADGPVFALATEWTPHGGSPNADLAADLVFAGHGVAAPERGHDDYAGLDVRGKIVVVRGDTPPDLASNRPTRLDRLIAAREHGAAALLLVDERLPSLDATATRVDLPSGTITPAVAAALSAHPGVPLRLRIALGREDRTASNVVGILPGTDPALAGEAVVVGAHYDHLGREHGVLHPGADDNASGTAVVLGLARAFAAAGGAPRTLVFVLFGAEELGLVGSRHFVTHPAVPMERTVAMLNFDMVGRLRNDRLWVSGVDSGTAMRGVVIQAAAGESLAVEARGTPYAPSDHVRFYSAGAPVLFFYTGQHEDYHRPGDTADKINAPGMARIAAMGAGVIERLAGGPRPVYVKVAPPERPSAVASAPAGSMPRTPPPGTALFGVIGDGRGEADGVRVGGVMPGSAAARAGLAEGDVIVRFAGTSVTTFDELRGAVQARRPGDRVSVVFLRDGRARAGSETLDAVP
jgi:hypothetical protein